MLFSIVIFQPDKRILRLALNSFGSPLWSTFTSTDEMMSSISWFLLALRSVLRNAFAVCLLSIPVHLYEVNFNNVVSHHFFLFLHVSNKKVIKCLLFSKPFSNFVPPKKIYHKKFVAIHTTE